MGSGPGGNRDRVTEQPMLHVRLLGGVDLRLGTASLPPLDSARAESLVAYLLLHREAAQPRQRLAFLLWPDSSESQARTNLRHVLHNLRRALPDADRFIDVGPRTLRWRPEAPLWLDVEVVEQAVADGRLEEAVEVYTGDLLDGCYDDWLLDERERLRGLHIDALTTLAQRMADLEEWGRAVGYAQRVLRHDPLREETWRLLMRLHDASGDRAQALRAYHGCETTLQRELGVEPSAATRAVYEALLPPEPQRQSQARTPATIAGTPLVGRAAERRQLAALWRAAEQGAAQLVMVTGEPGVGKSRLIDELRTSCAHDGAAIAEARAYRAEGAMAYGVVAAWMRSEPISTRLHRLDPVHLTDLARLVPELLADVSDVTAPPALSEDGQRQRLFAALARAISMPGPPLLLVLDDLQWCDAHTLMFVHYLLRAEPGARLLIAVTARREDLDAHHPAGELVAALQALARFTEIELGRLDRTDTGELAGRIAGGALTEPEADRLYAESEGNPLFVVEALRARGDAASSLGTGKVQAVIAARLAQLSEPAVELVGIAATIGREFTTQVLSLASGMEEQRFVGGLDELWRRGLVRAQGPNAYDFSHGRIREAAYLALSPAQASHHHRRVAQALAASVAGDGAVVASEVAAHYEGAGADIDAVTWYMRAADEAQRLYANADAVRFLRGALELTRGLPDDSARAELELRVLTALPAPLVAVEGYLSERVAEVHERALELARALDVEPEAPLVRSLALATLTRCEFEAARPLGEQLRGRAERDSDEVLWVEGTYVLAVSDYWQGRLEQAAATFRSAIGRCRPEHRAAHLLRYGQDPQVVCLSRLAHTLWLLGHDREAERTRDEALTLAQENGDPYSRAVATVWAGVLAMDQRDPGQLQRHVHALESGEIAYGVPQVRLLGAALAGLIDVLAGAQRDGIARIRSALADSLEGAPSAPGLNGILTRVLLEACRSGPPDAGLSVADGAIEMGGGAQLWEAEIRRLRAEFLIALGGAPEEIEAELARAAAVARRQRARSFELRIDASLARFRGTV